MSVGIAESAELSCRPTVVVKHADNVIDQALHLLQGEANAVAEGMKDVAQCLRDVICG